MATLILQPVPQKRHGALDQLSWVLSLSVTRFAAVPDGENPATAVAVAIAFALIKSLRVGFMDLPFSVRLLSVVIDHAGVNYTLDQLNSGDGFNQGLV